MVVDRNPAHVHGHSARRPLAVDHHGHRTALDAVTKADTAPARKPSVLESFEHGRMILQSGGRSLRPARSRRAAGRVRVPYNNASMSRWNSSRVAMPMCVRQSVPSRSMKKVTGSPHTGPYASWKSSRPSPTSIG